jgi:hypothetical protein
VGAAEARLCVTTDHGAADLSEQELLECVYEYAEGHESRSARIDPDERGTLLIVSHLGSRALRRAPARKETPSGGASAAPLV